MNKKLITSAVASAVALPTAAFAAIDDQGMAYVTAAEGLHGSLRMDLLLDTDEEERDASTETNSLRMWVNGTADLGGGLQSTYYWEFRGNEGDSGTDVQSNAWDIGLKGAFGEIEFGKLAMSSYRLVPSASLAFERGSERASPGADTRDGGWRYESPVINGFQFGVSGILNGADGIEGALNEYALAMKYTMPIGLEVGAAYESVKNEGRLRTVSGDEIYQQLHVEDNDIPLEDSQGYRFGMRYGQDNWLLAYEYRTYDSFVPDHQPIVIGIDANTSDTSIQMVTISTGEKGVDYNVHAFGVQVKLDRITMTANYSVDEVEFNVDNIGAGSSIQKQKFTKERDVIAIDAAYALGSRTHIVLGWKQQDRPDDVIRGAAAAGADADTPAQAAEQDDTSTTYLFYRVDF